MQGIIGPAFQWWDGRTIRERRMLIAMLVLVAATVLWLVVVRPALGWREAAADRRLRAETAASEVRRDLARLAAHAPRAMSKDPAGIEPTVRRTGEAAGLVPALVMDARGDLGFRLASASSGSALAWLATLEKDHHLQVCRLGVVENADATVSVEGSVTAGGCDAEAADAVDRSS